MVGAEYQRQGETDVDFNRIWGAANAVVATDGDLRERLEDALPDLVTLKGTAQPAIEEGLPALITQIRTALEGDSREDMQEAAWQVVRFFFEHEHRD